MKTKTNSHFIYVGIVACLLFAVFDIVCDFWFGRSLPHYSWLRESISRIGEQGSPMQHQVKMWGITATVLLLLFANSIRLLFKPTLQARLAALAIVIYALGEGLGSGLFPIDPLHAESSVNGVLHEVLSVIGDVGIVALPFILLRIPYLRRHSHFQSYLKWVIGIGFVCICLFVVAKYFPEAVVISKYKGLWQRLYTFNYHLMLVIISIEMLHKMITQPKPPMM